MARILPIRLNPFPPPTDGALSAPYYSPRINVQWFPFVWGLLDVLLNRELWEGTEAEIDSAIENVLLLMDEFDFPCPPAAMDVQPQDWRVVDGELQYTLIEGECSTLPEFMVLNGILYWRPMP